MMEQGLGLHTRLWGSTLGVSRASLAVHAVYTHALVVFFSFDTRAQGATTPYCTYLILVYFSFDFTCLLTILLLLSTAHV
jgi:hypothetical protein